MTLRFPPQSLQPHRLIVLECTAPSHFGPDPQSAWEHYRNASLRILRCALRRGRWPADLDVVLISTRYGLITPDTIVDGSPALSSLRSRNQLQHAAHRSLLRLLEARPYRAILVLSMEAPSPIRPNPAWYPGQLEIQVAAGSERARLECLCTWLGQSAPP